MTDHATEPFSPDQRRALEPFFGNLDSPIFVVRNLPEVVKGALFARYSRSSKSVRQLFLDEFLDHVRQTMTAPDVGVARAERLYARVFGEYGDDSVAQLGSAHIACEGVSNVLTKVLERGRLMSYLEQSTRYVPYTDRPGGRWKYVVPPELAGTAMAGHYNRALDHAFGTYAHWLGPIEEHFRRLHPATADESPRVYRAAIRAKALDTLRGLLPAATCSNVGIFGSGQAYEALLLRMRAIDLGEARTVADRVLSELRKVIPAFLTRVDREDRGVRWSRYLADRRAATQRVAAEHVAPPEAGGEPEVLLTDFDPDGEIKVVASALYPHAAVSEDRLLATVREMSTEERLRVLRAYVGKRDNRRHRPSRAFERTFYCFDILTDYGAFRDLQRHRLLSMEWQPLTTAHGFTIPAAIEDLGAGPAWHRVMDESAALYERLAREASPLVAQYAVSMAYRIRFYMHMNAREAMHVIELRTSPQGHPAYRRVCQAMHRLIAERAGHRAIAAAMAFADHSPVALERLEAERASARRRQSAAATRG